MKKGFFGYGRCPHCEAFLKEKDLVKNVCWSCDTLLDTEKAKLDNILSSIESTFDIKNESYDKRHMINYLKKVDINKFYEFFLSKYRKVSIQTFINKDMGLQQKYILLKEYDDKRSKIYDSIKKDLEKLVKRDKE